MASHLATEVGTEPPTARTRQCHVCRRPLRTAQGLANHLLRHLELLVYTPTKEKP